MIGTSNQTEISLIEETVPGQTPTSPALQIMRMTGESFQANNTTTESAEIRSDRSTSDLILTDQSNAGDLMGELSGATYDVLFKAVLFADDDWTSTSITDDTIAATATGFTDSSNGFITGGLQVGQYFKVTGFGTTSINRVYKVVTLAAGVIETYPHPAATAVAGTMVTIEGSTITNGVTDHSFTVVKKFKDLATQSYIIFRGSRCSKMAIDLALGAIAKITFSFMAETSEATETAIAGATYLPATTTDVMNCVSNVTSIKLAGPGVTSDLFFTDLSLSYDNALRELKAIGNLGAIDIRPGTIKATTTVNPYFENIELLSAFLANNSFELSFNMKSSDGYEYVVSYPRAKFSSQTLAAGAKDQDLVINGSATAILDPESLKTIRIDRFVPAP